MYPQPFLGTNPTGSFCNSSHPVPVDFRNGMVARNVLYLDGMVARVPPGARVLAVRSSSAQPVVVGLVAPPGEPEPEVSAAELEAAEVAARAEVAAINIWCRWRRFIARRLSLAVARRHFNVFSQACKLLNKPRQIMRSSR